MLGRRKSKGSESPPVGPVTYVIGDIHGCLRPLQRLLEKIAPQPGDEVVFIGDYIDRGPQSREVVEYLLGLPYRSVFLLGNHEKMLLDYLDEVIHIYVAEELVADPLPADQDEHLEVRPFLFDEALAMAQDDRISCGLTKLAILWSAMTTQTHGRAQEVAGAS